MSWLSFSDIAKSAFSEAQKRIDKVLDIRDEDGCSDQKVVAADEVGMYLIGFDLAF